MLYRFAGLELDDEARIVRADKGELTLQPRVFDLLSHLVRERGRVVPTRELVDQVWDGVYVTDGAVQRAMSVLRSTLSQSGIDDAIRTYPRQGYRFCLDVLEDSVAAPDSSTLVRDDLSGAREAFDAERWDEAIEKYRRADRDDGLSGFDLEHWGEAAEYSGRVRESLVPYERAVAAWSAAGERCSAGRAALRLANARLECAELAIAGGWIRRAERYLAKVDDCHEVALLAWLRSRHSLFTSQLEKSLHQAEEAYAIACRIEDRDVEALSILYMGLTRLALGEVSRGVELLDEAAAAVLAEGLGRWTGGIVYCGVIWGCLNRGDWKRAAEWTEHYSGWCSINGICGYPGLCRLHRSEVLTVQGRLDEAEREAADAAIALAASDPVSEGDAHRVMGEVRLLRGDLDGAEAAFRRAHELGWDPNPGYALLQAARGNNEGAIRSLEGALVSGEWSVRQRRGFLLAHLVTIAARSGETERASRAMKELDENAQLWETPAAAAEVSRARGELAFAAGDLETSIRHLREALRGWRDIGSLDRMAAVRLRLASVLFEAGDPDGAELELHAAESAYRHAGLDAMVEQCRKARAGTGQGGIG